MRTEFGAPVRLAAFGGVVLALFGLAFGVGRGVGPVADEEPVVHEEHGTKEGGHSAHDEPAAAAASLPGGLQSAQDGYQLRLTDDTSQAGLRPVAFTITGPDGDPVTAYDTVHEKQLHLIVVRRDLTGFQHVHPVLDEKTGEWTTDVELTPGAWRVFADFRATGAEALTLGTDLSVPGRFAPTAPGGEDREASVDGYEVTLDGDLSAGAEATLTLDVTKDGKPVTDLQPYLGAYGHLVALRGGDLAYLHVHPDGEPGDGETEPGPEIVFHTEVPSEGTYRLFLDFRHDGVVRTAAFTVHVGEGVGKESHGGESHEH